MMSDTHYSVLLTQGVERNLGKHFLDQPEKEIYSIIIIIITIINLCGVLSVWGKGLVLEGFWGFVCLFGFSLHRQGATTTEQRQDKP